MFKFLCWIWGIGLMISAAALVVAPPRPPATILDVFSPPEQEQLRKRIEHELRDFDSAKALRESQERIDEAERNLRAAERNLRAVTDASPGQCQNSNDLDARGHRCGGRAASERKGGR